VNLYVVDDPATLPGKAVSLQIDRAQAALSDHPADHLADRFSNPPAYPGAVADLPNLRAPVASVSIPLKACPGEVGAPARLPVAGLPSQAPQSALARRSALPS